MKSKRQRVATNAANSKRRRTADSEEDRKKICLPHELIFEILSNLPVISLLRFKAVCKLWRDMIRDPIFIEKHRKMQTCLAIACHGDETPTSDTDAAAESSTTLCFLHGLQLEKCNSTHTYSIKNPSTKQVLILPSPKDFVLIMTMCFISTSQEYKLVYLYLDKLTQDRLGCEVLTIGADSSWRSIDIPDISYDPNIYKLRDCILIDGVFYIMKDSEYGDSTLICIEMETEQFVQVNIPPNLLSDWNTIWPIRWDRTTLSVVNIVKQRLHVLKLEDYSKNRWSKNKIDIPLNFLKEFPDLDEDPYIRAITDDILLFILKAEHAIFYSIKSASVRYKASAPPGQKLFFVSRSTLVSLRGMQPVSYIN
ncbi:putative F-box protein At1g32420 [Primulina tabacum]|uniref:putative F-box protein At1g32420 n=1 Tax=Primulina tabacum TaxID=48773 RepID=UPI003F59199C